MKTLYDSPLRLTKNRLRIGKLACARRIFARGTMLVY